MEASIATSFYRLRHQIRAGALKLQTVAKVTLSTSPYYSRLPGTTMK